MSMSEPERGKTESDGMAGLAIAVLIPCYNEESTVGAVIDGFRRALPSAAIHVFDNASSDRTSEVALAHGAHLSRVVRRGKGNVIRRMFADVEADIYVLVDGDATYDASRAPDLVRCLVENGNDLVNGARKSEAVGAYRLGHRFGNRLLSGMVRTMFGSQVSDMLSGYKVFSRRFAKSFPAMSNGFEIETELTVHALELRMPIGEIETIYGERPEGSYSKLSTYRDGARILRTIIRLLRIERPRLFYGGLGAGSALLGVLLAVPLFITYSQTGTVPRLPTAVLSTGLVLLGGILVVAGLIMDLVTRVRQEMKCLSYLTIPSIRSMAEDKKQA